MKPNKHQRTTLRLLHRAVLEELENNIDGAQLPPSIAASFAEIAMGTRAVKDARSAPFLHPTPSWAFLSMALQTVGHAARNARQWYSCYLRAKANEAWKQGNTKPRPINPPTPTPTPSINE